MQQPTYAPAMLLSASWCMKRSTTAKTAAADPDTSFYDLLFPRGQPTSAGEWSTEWAERETRARPGQTGRGRRGQRAVGTRIPDAAGGLLKAALPAAPRSPTVGAAMPGVRSGYLFFIYPPPLSLAWPNPLTSVPSRSPHTTLPLLPSHGFHQADIIVQPHYMISIPTARFSLITLTFAPRIPIPFASASTSVSSFTLSSTSFSSLIP